RREGTADGRTARRAGEVLDDLGGDRRPSGPRAGGVGNGVSPGPGALPPWGRSPVDRGMGGAARLWNAGRASGLADPLQPVIPAGTGDSRGVGDRADDPVRAGARDDRPARKLVRAGQPESPEPYDLH